MFKAVVAAIAFACLSLPAHGAVFLTFNGSTGVFGNDQVDSPSFDDSIDLGSLSPGMYLISATISSTYQDGNEDEQDIDFTSVMFNGVEFDIGETGQNEFRFVNSIVSDNTNLFTIRGTSGANSSYSGTVNVTSVPEPTTWAMALIGFFAVGSSIRRRKMARARLPQIV